MRVTLNGTLVDAYVDGGDELDDLVGVLYDAVEEMKADPGGVNREITLVIVNDFEDEESEDDESEDTTQQPKEG